MQKALALSVLAAVLALLVFPGDGFGFASDMVRYPHGTFVIVFVDAGNFLKGYF